MKALFSILDSAEGLIFEGRWHNLTRVTAFIGTCWAIIIVISRAEGGR